MDSRSRFQFLSELAEDALLNMGRDELLDRDLSRAVGTPVFSPCSGRLLYNLLWHHKDFENVFFDHEDQIILTLGDRTTSVPDGPYPCHGITSHAAALTIIDNVYFELLSVVLSELNLKSAPHWDELSLSQKLKVASVETGHQELRYCWSELANKVKTERLLYLKTLPQSPPATRYRKSELRTITGLANDALNEYLRAANLPIAPRGRGGASFEWQPEQVRVLLTTIISTCTDLSIKKQCKTALIRFSNPI